MTKETGGPAFPFSHANYASYEGMTLRDYFAVKTLQGMLSSTEKSLHKEINKIAEAAYMMADAMLKAR